MLNVPDIIYSYLMDNLNAIQRDSKPKETMINQIESENDTTKRNLVVFVNESIMRNNEDVYKHKETGKKCH